MVEGGGMGEGGWMVVHAHIHGRLPTEDYAQLVVGEALEEVDGDELCPVHIISNL